jgi:hypothetical protein
VKTMELAEKTVGNGNAGPGANQELLSALAGRQASRDAAVAHRTRRVVMASMGVLQEQKAGRKRSRAVAISFIIVALLVLGPAVWRVADDLIGGDRFSDVSTQFSLWFCFLCVAIVAAVLVAGWTRRKS